MNEKELKAFKEFYSSLDYESEDAYYLAFNTWKKAIEYEQARANETLLSIRDRLRSKSVSFRAFKIIDTEISKFNSL